MPNRIPKRIIQFWMGLSAWQSLRHRAAMANMRLMNPDYEYLFFDDAQVREFVTREFPEYRDVFESFRLTIQKCDFFRYLAVYRYGGFYFDLDVLLASGLSALLDYGCVFPFEALTLSRLLRDELGMDWQVGNYAFGATPGHPFLEAIIKNCVRGQNDPLWVKPMMRGTPPPCKDQFFIINSTGPGVVTRTFAESGELAKTVTILFPNDVDVCDVEDWNHFGEYGIHLADSSWRSSKGFVRDKIAGYWWRWIQNRRVKESRRLGKTRYQPGSSSARCDLLPHLSDL